MSPLRTSLVGSHVCWILQAIANLGVHLGGHSMNVHVRKLEFPTL